MLESIRSLLLAEYSVGHWMLVFLVYSFAGWCWEVALHLVQEHRFVNRGFLTGPLLPIYGFGAVGILMACLPFADRVWLVALVGCVAATLMELVTGALMEAFFHVRYWDYSHEKYNLRGYICLKASAVWALFSALVVCVVHPFFAPHVRRIPEAIALGVSLTLLAFALADTVVAVRRALDLRAMLESIEEHIGELNGLSAAIERLSMQLNSLGEQLAQRVDEGQTEFAAKLERMIALREHVAEEIEHKRLVLEENIRERFTHMERMLEEAADTLPDLEKIKQDIAALSGKYEALSVRIHASGNKRMARAKAVLRANPGAISKRHGMSLSILRECDEMERRMKRESSAERKRAKIEKNSKV